MLENLNKIEIQNPVKVIIYQIRELIKTGVVKPGDKLPPERKLAEHFGVSRGQVREALNKLQIYGIVKVAPQSGTTVNGIGMVALEGMLTDILEIEQVDFMSLVETRVLLEKEASRLAALNRTEQHIAAMSQALEKFEEKLNSGQNAVEEDLLFHVKIAEASGNTVLKSLMMIITLDIVKSFKRLQICDNNEANTTIKEHREIYDAIVNQDSEAAINAMEEHLKDIVDYTKQNKN